MVIMDLRASHKVLQYVSIMLLACVSMSVQAADTSAKELIDKLNTLSGSNVSLTYHQDSRKVSFLTTQPGAALAQPFNGLDSSDPVETAKNFLTEYQSLFGEQYKAEYSLISNNENNNRHSVKFRQTHRGIPVYAGEMVVRLNALLEVSGANGEVSSNLNISTKPAITADEAQQVALTRINKKHNNSVFSNLNATTNKPTLWIYNPSLIGKGADTNKLVWQMEVTGQQGEFKEFVMVDAHTGAIALHFNLIMTAKNREVYDNTNTAGQSLPGPTIERAEGDPVHAVQDVNDAYDFSGDTYDFFFTNHGRDSLDNAGMTLISTVRHCDPSFGCPMQNAFWNGAQMAYGEGFAVDDVVAHELTHAVTQFTSNLIYQNQSGAINESFSDVWGEFVDLTNGAGTDTSAVRWQLGEDVPGIGALRNLQDPTVFNDPDKVTSALYRCTSADNGGVHSNSGVNNKAVYLMTDGDTFNGITVAGIGIIKVAKIYYEAQTNILTSGSTYLNLYNALNTACTTLVGTDGITATDCASVTNAINAVEMNQPVCVTPPVPVCPAETTPTDLFNDGFESGLGSWTHAADQGADVWSLGTTNPKDGTNHIHGDDVGSISDSSIANNTAITLPANAYLRFDHAYDFEAAYDGGVIEYSIDDGTSWTDGGAAIIDNGYTGTINSAFGNPLAGRAAFVGDSMGNYTSSRLDLSALAGQDVKLRFRIGTDSSVSNPGWDIDNVRVYTCDQPVTDPVITSPTSGATLSGSSETFTWTGNSAVSTWWLYVGSAVGTKDIANIESLDAATTSYTVSGLPTDGSTVYVRLWYFDGAWKRVDESYTASDSGIVNADPVITSPTSGATLSGSSETFTWTGNSAVSTWWLYVGSAVGTKDIANIESLDAATTSYTVSGLPTDGSTVYVRLWYFDGAWKRVDESYTASDSGIVNADPVITSPTSGATLSGSSETFTWTGNSAVSTWWLYVGSAVGTKDIANIESLDAAITSYTVSGLPTDGSTVYVRLWYFDGAWKRVDEIYTAADNL